MFTLNCKGRLLEISKPIVMGIINVTPDSFYTDSRTPDVQSALLQAEKMLSEGAAILDIGGQSTRPGSVLLSAEEEAQRVLPVIEAIKEKFPDCFISIDTFYASTAAKAIGAGADIVNDISGGSIDENMLATVAGLQVPYICMHMKGTPQTMQSLAVYDNLLKEVSAYFSERIQQCEAAGIKDVIIDPGFGFAKTIQHNFSLLNKLELFRIFEKPVLLGVSRKSTVYKTLNTDAEHALNGTTVLNTIGLMKGANILRVHDVREAVEAIDLVFATNQ